VAVGRAVGAVDVGDGGEIVGVGLGSAAGDAVAVVDAGAVGADATVVGETVGEPAAMGVVGVREATAVDVAVRRGMGGGVVSGRGVG
jgi:hypothetical protein